jgi:hypothetical protein
MAPPTAKMHALIDWAKIQIRPDPRVTTVPTIGVGIHRDESEKYLEVYADVYFEQFHHHWPILHRPSQEEEVAESDLCELSVKVVGAWVLGTSKAVQFALETHTVLVNHIMTRLV